LHRLGYSFNTIFVRRWIDTVFHSIARPLKAAASPTWGSSSAKPTTKTNFDFHRNDEVQFAIAFSLGHIAKCLVEPVLDDKRVDKVLGWIEGHYRTERERYLTS
jgi:hypothetical protein